MIAFSVFDTFYGHVKMSYLNLCEFIFSVSNSVNFYIFNRDKSVNIPGKYCICFTVREGMCEWENKGPCYTDKKRR